MTKLTATFAGLLALCAFPKVGFALDYSCSSDPGFCYLDTANDGCFDSGTDVGSIDDDLKAGRFPAVGTPSPGSIVCPPSVRTLKVTGTLDWSTAPGGDIIIHKARILPEVESPAPSMSAGGDILFAGLLKSAGATLLAQGDAMISGRMLFKSTAGFPATSITATDGTLKVGPKAAISGGTIALATANGGDIEIQNARIKSQEGGLQVSTAGDVLFERVKILTAGLDVDANDIRGEDVLNIKIGGGAPITMDAAGDIRFKLIKVVTLGPVALMGGVVEFSTPELPTFKYKTSRLTVGGGLEITATTGRLRLWFTRVRATSVLLTALQWNIEAHVGSSYTPYPGATTAFPLQLDTPHTCHIKKAKLLGAQLITSCHTVH